MSNTADTNAEIWKSEEVVQTWAATAKAREAKHAEPLGILAKLLPFDRDDAFTFADLGAGTGAAARAVLARYPRSQAVLTDFSDQMIEEATHAMAEYEDRYRYVTFDMLNDPWPDSIPAELDAIVTSLCIHHMPDERKRGLFVEIFDRLVPGGWYMNYDPVTSDDPVIAEMWQRVADIDDPVATEERIHPSPEQHARYQNHVRYMIPLEPQLEFLRAAGFSGIDVYWKYMGNTVYGGLKAR
jgi:tRNA (cmo5U34)-methyltransferase